MAFKKNGANRSTHLKTLGEIADQYMEWFMQVLRRISYPDQTEAVTFSKPDGLLLWIDEAEKENFEPEILKRLEKIHDDLSFKVDTLINDTLKTGAQANYKDFNGIITLFEEFTQYIRRLEKDALLEDSGIDSLTGLRSPATLRKDLRRELDRLARQGKPFCIALVRINTLNEILEQHNLEMMDYCIKSVAKMIIKSMRSFDDAYRLDNNDFIVSLKQADISGGVRALERLKNELERQSASFKKDNVHIPLTLSSCIAEPLPGDDISILLANLKSDLDTAEKQEGTILEYHEISPLQRYVQEIQD